MQSKKKISIDKLLIIIGLVIFFIAIFGFVINACMNRNITLAWLLLGFIFLGSGAFLIGIIMFIAKNKDKIKKYLNEIS